MDAFGEDMDDFTESLYKKVRKRMKMKKVAKEFLDTSEYSAAREVLQSLLPLIEDSEEQLESLLKIAQCDVMTGRKIDPNTDDKIMRLLSSGGKSCYEMREFAQNNSGIEAIVSFLYALKLYRLEARGNKAVKDAESCIMKAATDIGEMAKVRELKPGMLKTYPLTVQMLEEMKGIEGADPDMKASSEATVITKIGYLMNKLGRKEEAYNWLRKGREFMADHFGVTASRYNAYAAMANNIAVALVRRGKFAEAARFHKNAIMEMEDAEDMPDAEKQQQLSNFRSSLEYEEHMATWIKSNGMADESAVEMACEAAYGAVDNDDEGSAREKLFERMGGNPFRSDTSGPSATSGSSATLEELLRSRLLEGNDDSTDDVPIEKAVKELINKGSITQDTEEKILSHFQQHNMSWEDVRKMATKNSGAGAVILHMYACRLLPFSEAPPDKVLREIGESFKRSRVAIDEMIKGNGAEIAKKLVSLLHEMLKELREVSCCTEALKVQIEATCLNKLGSIYTQLTKFQPAVTHLSQGRTVMTKHFGSAASRNSLFASLANNLGYAYAKQGNHINSARYYEKAFTDLQGAEDLTATEKNEKLAAYATGFTDALSKADGTNSEGAARLREEFSSHDIMRMARHRGSKRTSVVKEVKNAEQAGFQDEHVNPHKTSVKTSAEPHKSVPPETQRKRHPVYERPFVDVGDGIYVDHTSPLREGYQVYKGKWRYEDVAVKKIDSTIKHKREVDIMKNMDKHPNTVEYKAWSEWESKEIPGVKAIYVAMELCENETLFELALQESFGVQERISALLQFTCGLCHIHQHGIIHGDLKPHNLLRSIKGGVVKVADFGISKKLELGKTKLTFTNQAGTYGWMAPDDVLTKKYDIFSAGLIYFFLLTNGQELTLDTDLDKVDIANAGIARDLISRMLNLDPKKRPTAEECCDSPLFWNEERKIRFLHDFAGYLSSMPKSARVIQLLEKQSEDVFGDNCHDKLTSTEGEGSQQGATGFDDVACQRALMELTQPLSLSSLIQFITDHYRTQEVEETPQSPSYSKFWKFLDAKFPRLFVAMYRAAQQCSYFLSAEEKLQLLSEISDQNDLQPALDGQVNHVFDDSWLDDLILEEEAVKEIQERVMSNGRMYRISKYSVYNRAASKDRKEEGDYDEKSLHSLLRFINNRRKYFKDDGKLAEWLFSDDTNGLWEFFSKRFPSLLSEIVLFSSELRQGNQLESGSEGAPQV